VLTEYQGLVPPTIYYARVVGELGKIMFQGRNMSPPLVYQPPISSPKQLLTGPATCTPFNRI